MFYVGWDLAAHLSCCCVGTDLCSSRSTMSLEHQLLLYPEGLPLVEDISCALDRCIKARDRCRTLHLYTDICRYGLEAHPLLGNQLVSVLVNVGSVKDGQCVFNKLSTKKESSWNSLISGHIEHGNLQLALLLYEKMREDDSFCPNPYTTLKLLKTCATLKDLERGHKIHADVDRIGLLQRYVVVGNAVINMYVKCQLFEKAYETFQKLPVQNVVSWNTLITGYIQHGFPLEALTCFDLMQSKCVRPDSVTYICSLKACGNMGELEKGQEIHAEIERKGLLEDNLHLGSALIDMYAKLGFLAKAQEVFDKLFIRNVVSWNALIGGYAEYGHGDRALHYFDEMQLDGVPPDAISFICALKACGNIGAISEGENIYMQTLKIGLFEKNNVIGSALVNMYAKCGLLTEARSVLDMLPLRNVIAWTSLITGYADQGHGDEALNCYQEMQVEGISPNVITYVSSLKACGSAGNLEKGKEIHAEIVRKELLKENATIGSALVDMYVRCGLFVQAQEVFDQILDRNVVLWNTLISGYVEHDLGEKALNCYDQMQSEGILPDDVTYLCSLKACGNFRAKGKGQKLHVQVSKELFLEDYPMTGNALVDMYAKCGMLNYAHDVFDELPLKDIVSWNALIAGYAQHEYGEEALICLEEMQTVGIHADVITFICILKACGCIGASTKGQVIHLEIAKESLESDPLIGNALVDMYAKCGLLNKAEEVFEKLVIPDLITWTALLAGHAQFGESEKVFRIFEKMISEGLNPNQVTFVSLLNACSHAGLVHKGQAYFDFMIQKYGIVPTSEHHTCMVDLFCRAGQIEKAVTLIEQMNLITDVVAWHSILGACQKWNHVNIARQAFEYAVHVDDMNSAAYISMSNVYADTAMHDDVNEQTQTSTEWSWWIGNSGDTYVADGEKQAYRTKDNLRNLENSQEIREQSSDLMSKENGCRKIMATVSGLLNTYEETTIHIIKRMRLCMGAHLQIEHLSEETNRRIIAKDAFRVHVFDRGKCVCR